MELGRLRLLLRVPELAVLAEGGRSMPGRSLGDGAIAIGSVIASGKRMSVRLSTKARWTSSSGAISTAWCGDAAICASA